MDQSKDFVGGPVWWCKKSYMADGCLVWFWFCAIISALMNIFRQIWYRDGKSTWARAEEIKKEGKKARKEAYSGKLGVRPDHPRWRSEMWSCLPGGLREVVLSLKFRQNRLNGFRDVGGRNLPFPIPKASGLYNSLYYRTSRDVILCQYFNF